MATCDEIDLENELDIRNDELCEQLREAGLPIAECSVCRSDAQPATIPCGLCVRRFHSKCLGLPDGSPAQFVRGLYLCQHCLDEIRELLLYTKHSRESLVTSLVDTRGHRGDSRLNQSGRPNREAGAALEFETKNGEFEGPNADRENLPENSALRSELVVTKGAPNNENIAVATSVVGNMTFTCHSDQQNDNYLYCDLCVSDHLGNCPIHGPMNRVPDSHVCEGDPLRAENSLPTGLVVRPSSYPHAGLGVWADVDVPERTVFGPFVGRIVSLNSTADISAEYSWLLTSSNLPRHCIDGSDIASSNWMRYVNCAHDDSRQNLMAFQYRGHIFYKTIKYVKSGSELLVWYGDEYAKVLGLRTERRNSQAIQNRSCGTRDAFLSRQLSPMVAGHDTNFVSPKRESSSPTTILNKLSGQHSATTFDEFDFASVSPTGSQQLNGRSLWWSSSPPVANKSPRRRSAAFIPSPIPLVDEPAEESKPELLDSDQDKFPYDYVVCSHCPLGFSCPKLLDKHVKDVHKSTLLTQQCPHCQRRFSADTYLLRHVQAMHSGVPRTRVKLVQSRHEQSTPAIDLSTCSGQLQQQQQSGGSTNGKVQCLYCGLRCAGMRYLRQHVAAKHPSDSATGDVAINSGTDVQTRTPSPEYECVRRPSTSSSFVIRISRQKKSRYDPRVGASAMATAPRPYKCNVCANVEFKQRSHLTEHNFHVHGISIVYGCQQCQLHFDFYRELMAHHRSENHHGLQRMLVGPSGEALSSGALVAGTVKIEKEETRSLMPRAERLKPHRCECNLNFRTIFALRQHQYKAHGYRITYMCKVCRLEFKVFAELRNHRVESGHKGTVRKLVGAAGAVRDPDRWSEPTRIPLRSRASANGAVLGTRPLQSGSGADGNECPSCHFTCKTRLDMRRHQVERHSVRFAFECRVCGHQYSKFKSLRGHQVDSGHSGSDRRTFKPDYVSGNIFCNNRYKVKEEIESATDEISPTASVNSGVTKSRQLASLNAQDRPHACHLCEWRFTRAAHLRRHLTNSHKLSAATVTKPKPVQCLSSRRSIRQKTIGTTVETARSGSRVDSRQRKQQSSPGNSPQRYKCHICAMAFSRTNHVRYHLASIHGLSVTYRCACGQTFVAYPDLQAHQTKLKHSGVDKVFDAVAKSGSDVKMCTTPPASERAATVIIQPPKLENPAEDKNEVSSVRQCATPSLRPQRIRHRVQKMSL